ncbi:hypothetical protein AB0E67_36115 [Streptomyces sp. NPDC032161]|uniref:hypothetical protein n=1 Tax=unclassified Streptomyces TaxID=2593676 RepID=UPI0033E8BD33
MSRFAAPFSRASGELRLEEVDFTYPERPRRHRAPPQCAYVPDFITFDSTAAERVWGRAESAAGLALKALDAGKPLAAADYAALRDLAALHWVRCWYVKQSSEEAWEEAKDEAHAKAIAWAEGPGQRQSTRPWPSTTASM